MAHLLVLAHTVHNQPLPMQFKSHALRQKHRRSLGAKLIGSVPRKRVHAPLRASTPKQRIQ